MPDAIPADLVALPQWVCWRWEWIPADGRWTKIPVNAANGRPASTTAPATWTTFVDALAFARRAGLPGVGFVVTEGDPFVGIDLDKCRDPQTGEIDAWAGQLIETFDSYTEISPSGTGVRIWIRTTTGLLPDGSHGKRKGKIEAYGAWRYFTVTGHRLAVAR